MFDPDDIYDDLTEAQDRGDWPAAVDAARRLHSFSLEPQNIDDYGRDTMLKMRDFASAFIVAYGPKASAMESNH